MEDKRTYTAFAGEHLVGTGGLRAMLGKVKAYLDDGGEDRVLIFEDQTGRQVDFDFRGTPQEVLDRADPGGPRTGPGRPKLGVVAREITLLPRHWEWLERQPSGASAALRRLVDEARRREPGRERARVAREAASKVMWAMAGDLPNFEEASRALFGSDLARFEKLIAAWPKDLRKHLARLVREAAAMEEEGAAGG
ncbi:DUF2239 family protein [Paludisphaera sp.]|uniref:DUF2239 family protein n=1 Tax=Paludisphaera sp. TaxID=2017432 RepID=UPI00301E477D